MQTVQFQCSHCGNLMGVSVEFLGHQVRCPTCQQVVVAPESDPQAPSNEVDNLILESLQSAPLDAPKPEPALAHAPAPESNGVATAPEPHADSSLPWHDPAATAERATTTARAIREAGGGISWLWLLPLISYSLLATGFAVYVYLNLKEANATIHRLDDDIKARQLEDLKRAKPPKGPAD